MNTTTHANALAPSRYQTFRAEAIGNLKAMLKALEAADDADSRATDIDAGDMAHFAAYIESAAAEVLPVIDPSDRDRDFPADLPF
jgi:hypothetical protein